MSKGDKIAKKNKRVTDASMKVFKILRNLIDNNMEEISEAYDIPQEDIQDMVVSLFVHDTSKVQWKSYKTRFVKLYEKELDRIIENNLLKDDELGKLLKLSRRINYEDNILKNPDGSYMCQKDIMEYLGIKKTKTVELMKVFSKHYLIFSRRDDKKDKRKNIFYISPELFFIGTHIKREIKYHLDKLSKELDEVKEGVETENLEVVVKVDDSTIEISEEAIDEFIDCIIKCDVDGIV